MRINSQRCQPILELIYPHKNATYFTIYYLHDERYINNNRVEKGKITLREAKNPAFLICVKVREEKCAVLVWDFLRSKPQTEQ